MAIPPFSDTLKCWGFERSSRCSLQQLLREVLCRSTCGTFGASAAQGASPDRLASIQLMVHWWFQTYLFLMFRKHIIYIWIYLEWWSTDERYSPGNHDQRICDSTNGTPLPPAAKLPSAPLTLPTGSISRKKWDYNFNMSFSEPIWAFNHWDLNIKYLHTEV